MAGVKLRARDGRGTTRGNTVIKIAMTIIPDTRRDIENGRGIPIYEFRAVDATTSVFLRPGELRSSLKFDDDEF